MSYTRIEISISFFSLLWCKFVGFTDSATVYFIFVFALFYIIRIHSVIVSVISRMLQLGCVVRPFILSFRFFSFFQGIEFLHNSMFYYLCFFSLSFQREHRLYVDYPRICESIDDTVVSPSQMPYMKG